jgi:hypothetical protein
MKYTAQFLQLVSEFEMTIMILQAWTMLYFLPFEFSFCYGIFVHPGQTESNFNLTELRTNTLK